MRRPSKQQVKRISNKIIDRNIDRKVGEIFTSLPEDLKTTIGLGFYEMDGVVSDAIGERMDDFLGFNDYSEDDTPDSTTSVNGAFGTNGMYDGLDNFQDAEEMEVEDYNFSSFNELDFDHEFDNFSFKKLKKGIKKGVKKIKKGVKKTASKVKKGLKKLSIKNIVKTIKKAGKDIGNFVKKGALFIPRQSARALLAVNLRGHATKLAHAKKLYDKKGATKSDKKWKEKIDKKWKSLGGKNSSLWSAIRSGAKKKPLFCGAKCKRKLAKATGKKSGFLNANGQVIDYGKWQLDPNRLKSLLKDSLGQSNAEPISTATLLATGGTVVASVIGLVGGMKQSKSAEKMQKDALEVQKASDDKQYELMAKEQDITKEEAKRQLDLVQKQVTDELDPVNQILNNPNLTQKQKTEAVKQVQEVLAVKEGQKKSKILLYAGIGLVALLGAYFVFSGNKK
tara:strand:+ start:5519 stop:6871 length:1353 start_codon:yes stop_codon:yes gene_type:complete